VNKAARRMDDLVLNGGYAERPLSAIRLRYVSPTGRQRSIRPCVYQCVEILEVTLEAFRVLVPRHAIHARRSPLLQTEESPLEELIFTAATNEIVFSGLPSTRRSSPPAGRNPGRIGAEL
jgi:hypothetical protein